MMWYSAQPLAPAPAPAPVPARMVERPKWRILSWRIVPPPVDRSAKLDWVTLAIVLAMTTVSAGLSIYGLTSIFVGGFWPVIALGAVLELGKLRAVFLIEAGRGSRKVRAGLVVMVLVLMMINAAGVFGFLSKAHIVATEKTKASTKEGKTATAASLAAIDGKIAVQNTTIANINKQLSQIDGAIEKGIAQGKVNGAMALANQQRDERAQLQTDLRAAGTVLGDLKFQKAKIEPSPGKEDEKGKDVDADLGPVRYLTELLGVGEDIALRVAILVLACLLDPFAVLLLLCATAQTNINRAGRTPGTEEINQCRSS
jgi:hypothetical protein